MNEDMVLKKLNEHDKRFDTNDKQFDMLAKRFDMTDKRFDVLESEFQGFKNQMYTTQDQILTIVRRLEDERVFSVAWVQRVEKEISTIKAHLKLS